MRQLSFNTRVTIALSVSFLLIGLGSNDRATLSRWESISPPAVTKGAKNSQDQKAKYGVLFQQVQSLIYGKDTLSGLPSRALYWEQLPELIAKAHQNNQGIQVAHLKIRDFKGLNELGEKNYFYEYLGDKVIRHIGGYLDLILKERLAKQRGIEVHLYNRGPSFFIVFLTPDKPEVISVQQWLELLLIDDDFKYVLTEVIKEDLRQIEEVRDPRPNELHRGIEIPDLEERLKEVKPEILNFYVGFSDRIQVNPKSSSLKLRDLRAEIDLQAQHAAKVAQLIADHDFSRIWSSSVALIEADFPKLKTLQGMKQFRDSMRQKWQDYLKPTEPSLMRSLAKAQTAKETSTLSWGKEMEFLILWLKEWGVVNVFEEFYTPKREEAQEETFDSLFTQYRSWMDQGGWENVDDTLEKILAKVVDYRQDRHGIFRGKEFCHLMMNYIIKNHEDLNEDWRAVFRLGGDEIIRLDWDAFLKTLSIFYGDIHHLGQYNLQWGHEVGDRIIEETLYWLLATEDPEQLAHILDQSFRYEMHNSLVLEEDHPSLLKLKQAGHEPAYSRVVNGKTYFFYHHIPTIIVESVKGERRSFIESYPMLSLGALQINVPSLKRVIESKGMNFDRDFLDYSELIGRAFSASQVAKKAYKKYQADNPLFYRTLNPGYHLAYREADSIPAEAGIRIEGMDKKEFNELEKFVASWMWDKGLFPTRPASLNDQRLVEASL